MMFSEFYYKLEEDILDILLYLMKNNGHHDCCVHFIFSLFTQKVGFVSLQFQCYVATGFPILCMKKKCLYNSLPAACSMLIYQFIFICPHT